jgi:hypothetical protein
MQKSSLEVYLSVVNILEYNYSPTIDAIMGINARKKQVRGPSSFSVGKEIAEQPIDL